MTRSETAGGGARGLALLVRDCVATGIARRVLILRLSRLPSSLAKPHHVRLAHQAIEPLTLADRARRFELPNLDVAIVWRGEARQLVNQALAGIRSLFGDTAAQPVMLVDLIELPRQADLVLRVVEASLAPVDPTTAAAETLGKPLDPESLDQLERMLTQADLARFARRKPVCRLGAPDGGSLCWEKRFFSIRQLAEELTPGCDLRGDPWLFRRLTRSLDRRLLALLSSPDELGGAGPFALALNVASILGPEFQRFDAALPVALRGQVLIELRSNDILADPGAYLLARDFARLRGFRVALAGAVASLLDLLVLAEREFDVILLRWSAEMAAVPPQAIAAVSAAAEQLVLCKSDNMAAISWGFANGISLFQGRLATIR